MLVHGLWLSGWAMALIGMRLRRCGYRPYFFSYRSVRDTLRQNARALRAFSDRLEGDTVHFVGHSLGGVVIQAMLAHDPLPRGGRIVTICSPHAGSAAARALGRRPWGAPILGASIAELLRGNVPTVATAAHPVALIKGNLPIGLGRLFTWLPGPNDGVVLLDEMRWPGAVDEITLHVSHSGTLLSRRVAARVCEFLRFGRFIR